MMKMNITARVLGLLVLIALLAGCGASPTTVVQQPTADPSIQETAAAQTAVVKSTLLAALNTATSEAPAGAGDPQQEEGVQATATTQPTEAQPTEAATATPAAADATATPQAPAATATPLAPAATATINPALYPSRTPDLVADQAAIVSSLPADGTSYNAGEAFDAVWNLKNTGPTTWTTDYYIRFARGVEMSEAPRYYLKGEVKPGETAEFVADMIAPQEKGVQVGYWEFVNGNGEIIFHMYVAITVK